MTVVTYLHQQSPNAYEESHEIPRIIGDDIGVVAAGIFGSCMHSRLDRFARGIHEKLGKPFEDHLDLLGVWFGQVGCGERDTDVVDTSCDFSVGLWTCEQRFHYVADSSLLQD
jgi:hypothetical protein